MRKLKFLHVPSKWYSHLNEIGAGLSVVFVFGFLIRIIFLDAGTEAHDNSIQIIPAILAVLNLVYIFAFYRLVAKKDSYIASAGTVAFILLIVSIQTAQTGNLGSVYLTLWVVAILLLGMFGWQVLAGVQILSNIYILFFASTTANGFWPLFISFWTTQAPFIISWLLWHGTDSLEFSGKQEQNASTETLSTVDINTKSNVIVSSITEGVIAINQARQIELINPAAQTMTDWNENDSLGLQYDAVLRLVDPDTEEEMNGLNDPIAKVFTSSLAQSVPSNVHLLSRSERRLPISINISPIINQDTQEVVSVVAVFKDMTKTNLSERQRAEFISTASHEMRTPVAAIEGYLGLALNEKVATVDDKARSYLTKAHTSTQHLGRLLKDLLTAAKSEDGRLDNNPRLIELSEFVKGLALDFVFRAKEKNLLIKTAFEQNDQSNTFGNQAISGGKKISPLYYVNADPERLREVIVNLFENALKYTKQGSIIFDIKATKSEVVLSIADTGIGISKTELPHLFQKFYRIDSSDTREIGGTGLGLFLCRQLVEMQGGRIWVESELNLGSTFFVALPRVSSDRAQVVNDNSKQKIEVLQK